MPSPVQIAVDTYIRASTEPDPALREKMVEACFAADGRWVTRSRELRGRAELLEEMAKQLADPRLLRIRVVSEIDASGTTFRYRSVVERRDGSTLEFFDAGEIDASGRICLMLLFAGPLADAGDEPTGR